MAKAQLWETATGKVAAPPIKSGDAVVFAVAIRSDGQAVLTADRAGRCNNGTRNPVNNWGLRCTTSSLRPPLTARTGNSRWLVSAKQLRAALEPGHRPDVRATLVSPGRGKSVSYSPDGRIVLTGSEGPDGAPVGSGHGTAHRLTWNIPLKSTRPLSAPTVRRLPPPAAMGWSGCGKSPRAGHCTPCRTPAGCGPWRLVRTASGC